ncbi:MAG: hypothetical protein WCO54_00015 [Bacteroidota bacterium]
MKKIILPLILVLTIQVSYGQKIRFNDELDQFCKSSIIEFSSIPFERKNTLDNLALQLSKKKYILFTCQTNSRRTLLLQVWAQTAFYYYGLNDKFSFSIGDTLSNIYHGVVDVLKESGYSYLEMGNNDSPKGYMISISKKYNQSIIVSKKNLGTVDTAKVLVVNICTENEKSLFTEHTIHSHLPYQSPIPYEKTVDEKQKYFVLNKQISIEMLYLAEKTKEYVLKNEEQAK